jgi:hypothetical protein
MKKTLLFLLLIIGYTSSAQNQYKLHFTPKVAAQEFALGQAVTSGAYLTSFDYFNYYISNLHLIYDGGQDLDLSDSVYLVKHDNFILDLGQLNISNIEKIKFGVGVPIELSHLDISLYPLDHPLSYQTPSMQWGWTSGYNQMIVGGSSDSDGNQTTDAYFEIHSLGDNNFHEIEVITTEIEGVDGKKIKINCNLDTWLGQTNLNTVGIKHGSSGDNFNVMKNVSIRPVFTSDYVLGLKEVAQKEGNVYFTTTGANTLVFWNEIKQLNSISVVDMNGKLISTQNVSEFSGKIELNEIKKGVYFVSFLDNNNNKLNELKIAL